MREAVINRLCEEIGIPPDTEGAIPLLPAVLLAWSDGTVDDREILAIRRRAEAKTLSEEALRAVYDLLEKHPGPYFAHRALHLLSAVRERIPVEERERWVDDLEHSAEDVAIAGSLFARVFGIKPREREDLARLAEALDGTDPARIDELLDRLVTVSSLRVAGLAALAAEGAKVDKTARCEMGQDGPIQALAIRVEVPGWDPLVAASVEQFAEETELSSKEVAEILAHTAHRPLIERWIAIRQAVHTFSRPLAPDERSRLLGKMESEAGARVLETTLPEFSDLEDRLAKRVGFVAWLAGSVDELRIDAELIRRRLAPGTIDLRRKHVLENRVVRRDQYPVQGLRFPVIEIHGVDGATLRLATPEVATAPPTEAACTWIGRFVPVLRDPRSEVLIDDLEDPPHWTIEMRSGMLDREPDPPVDEPLPPGRALVVPPWTWLRCCWALGIDPEPPSK